MTRRRLPASYRTFCCGLEILLLVVLLVVAGCDSGDPDDSQNQIASVEISPDTVSIAEGERVDFSVVARNASGERVQDADLDLRWESTDSAVFTVDDDGVATGQGPGTAFCTIAVTNRFVGRDSALVSVF